MSRWLPYLICIAFCKAESSPLYSTVVFTVHAYHACPTFMLFFCSAKLNMKKLTVFESQHLQYFFLSPISSTSTVVATLGTSFSIAGLIHGLGFDKVLITITV